MRGTRLIATLAAAGVTVAAVALYRGHRIDESRATRTTADAPALAEPDAPEPEPGDAPVAVTGSALPRLTIDGEVVDATDGRPIAEATIHALLFATVVGEAKSGADGTFSLDVPEKRRYALAAGAAGHVHSQIRSCWTRQEIEAEPGTRVRITLDPALRIRGVVTDQGGRGLPGATLQTVNFFVERETGSTALFVGPTGAVTARTDALGRFEIAEVPHRGRTTFLVTLDGYADGRLHVEAGDAPLPAEHAVRLDALPIFSGRVVGEDGRPIVGAAVMPLAIAETLSSTPKTEPDPIRIVNAPPVLSAEAGVFRVGWRRSCSSLLVWAFGFVPAIVPVHPHDLLRGSLFEVRIERAMELAGVARDDRGLPVEGARVRVHYYEMESGGLRGRLFTPNLISFPHDPEMRWDLAPRDPSGCTCLPEALTDAEGAFRLDAAARGPTDTAVIVSKEGYVDWTAKWSDGSPPMLARLVRAARLVVTAADARSGAPLPRFRVVVLNPASPMVDRTNPGTGEPVSTFVPPGTARVTVEAEGYRKSDVETIELLPGEELSRHFALDPK